MAAVYLRADKYLYKFVDRSSDLHAFSFNHFLQILYLIIRTPSHFLEYLVFYVL